jgi:uncharacterized protein (TIGR00369 family)
MKSFKEIFMDKIIRILSEIYSNESSIEKIMEMDMNFSDDFTMIKVMEILRVVYLDLMPFNQIIGIKIDSLTMDEVKIRIDMKQELVGNSQHNILHGGVISTIVDQAGGMIAQLNSIKILGNCKVSELSRRLSRFSTLDMHINFLNPGAGKYFITTSSIVKAGNKVIVVKIEVKNNDDNLIAIGTATYLINK